jgi:5-amino-6-(5-phosphoribosylamino)uracil reductase
MPQDRRDNLRAHATLLELGRSRVDVARLLEWLATERGCKVVLCEGGGVLVSALFAAHAVDELYLTLVPRILGGAGAPTIVEGDGFEPDVIPDAKLVSADRVGDELFLRYDFAWG